MPGVRASNHYYKVKMSAFSVNALEHSTVTAFGKKYEIKAYANAIAKAKPGTILSMVIDSYNHLEAIRMIHTLLPQIVAKNLKIVFRPDSGNPPVIMRECTALISELFGTTMNGRGFKVFNYGMGLLYGDGINEEMIRTLLKNAYDDGYAATNFLFGMGGALLQGVTRDTQKFAVKCSSAVVDGQEIEVYKDPVSDPGKKSKKGILDLEKRNGKYQTVKAPAEFNSELDLVFEDGKIYRQQTLVEVRRIAHGEF
jgi:nicotinamide phosphoribosyltransferase